MSMKKEKLIDKKPKVEFYDPKPMPSITYYSPEKTEEKKDSSDFWYVMLSLLGFSIIFGLANIILTFGLFVFLILLKNPVTPSLILGMFASGYLMTVMMFVVSGLILKGGKKQDG